MLDDRVKENSTPLSFPDRVTLELNNSCNLQCIFCPSRHVDAVQGFMSEFLFRRAIDEMAEHLPVALVPFFRGESLLHPRLVKFMSYAKGRGIGPVQLATNAMLLDEERGRGIIDAGVDFISFSIDTTNAADYERIRLGASYERVMANIERFLELRERMGAKAPKVQVSAVETESVKPFVEEFVRVWGPRVERVRIFAEHSRDGSFGSLDRSRIPVFPRRLPCRKVVRDMVVTWNGEIGLCNHDWNRVDPVAVFGDVTLAEIWQGARYASIRAMHIVGDVSDRSCQACDHWIMYYLPKNMIGKVYEKNPSAG